MNKTITLVFATSLVAALVLAGSSYTDIWYPPFTPAAEWWTMNVNENGNVINVLGQTTGTPETFPYTETAGLGNFAKRVQWIDFSGTIDEGNDDLTFNQYVLSGQSWPVSIPADGTGGIITGTVNFNGVSLTISADTSAMLVTISETANPSNSIVVPLGTDNRFRVSGVTYTYIGEVTGNSLSDITEWVRINSYNS